MNKTRKIRGLITRVRESTQVHTCKLKLWRT